MLTPKTILALFAACIIGVIIGAGATYGVMSKQGIHIQSFSVDTQEVLIGEKVTFSWTTSGASQIAFRFVHMPTGSHGDLWEYVRPEITTSSLPPAGQWSYTVAADLMDKAFKFEMEAADDVGNKIAVRSGAIVVKYRPCMDGSDECATPPTATQAMLQAFEHGYMLWREDTHTVYALSRDLAPDAPHFVIGWRAFEDTWAADQSFELAEQPPAGLLQPQGRFTKILAQYPDLLADLGWATAAEIPFEAATQLTRNICGASCGPTLLVKLDDARILRLSAASTPDFQQGYVWQITPAA